MVKLQITLSQAEADALARWSASELRDPRDQVRLYLRRELRRMGMLDGDRIPYPLKPAFYATEEPADE